MQTLIQTRREIKQKKNPSFILALSCVPRDDFLELDVQQTASSLRGKMHPKWHTAALLAGKRTRGNSGGDTQHQGSGTAVQLLLSIVLANATALQNGAISSPDGTTRGFKADPTRSSQQSMASVLLHHASQFVSARTQESCLLLHCIEGKSAAMPFSFNCYLLPLSFLSRSEPNSPPSCRPTRDSLTALTPLLIATFQKQTLICNVILVVSC